MPGLTFNIWSILILVGAAQGLLLSIFLFLKRENKQANKWLAFLLVIVSLHLLEYAAGISGITLRYPALIAITYPLLFCMGPLYFFYCRHLLDKNYRLDYKAILHFFPSVVVLLAMFPFYAMPAAEKVNFMKGLSDGNSIQIPAGQLVFMSLHVLQTVAYIFAAYKLIRKREEELKHVSSDVIVVKKLDWLNSFNRFFAVYLLLYLVLVVTLVVINSYQVQVDYVMLLITSCSIHAIGYAGIQNPEIFRALPDPPLQQLQIEVGPKDKPRNGVKHAQLKEKLLLYMERNKPHLKSDLKISELAELLSVQSYQLSQLINDEFSVSFYDFVNKYRVEEAKKLLMEDSRNYKMLAIAYEVGFNSKATFNRVFKKFTDLTPSDFKEKFSGD